MNLGPRCGQMLENRCQCPNTAIDNSEYCALHLTMRANALKPVDVNLTDKEPNAAKE